MFRSADFNDLDRIAAIYEAIHTQEEAGLVTTGWLRHIYPTRTTAERAIASGDMFVFEESGTILACGRINHFQDECYKDGAWEHPASSEQVMVLHTLVVEPAMSRNHLGTKFLQFYENYSLEHGCPCLRLDTNARNLAARAFYKKHGYQEVGIVPCEFNGIPDVQLVLLEKKL